MFVKTTITLTILVLTQTIQWQVKHFNFDIRYELRQYSVEYLSEITQNDGNVDTFFLHGIEEINRARKSADTEVPFRLNDLISGKDSVDFYRGTRRSS